MRVYLQYLGATEKDGIFMCAVDVESFRAFEELDGFFEERS